MAVCSKRITTPFPNTFPLLASTLYHRKAHFRALLVLLVKHLRRLNVFFPLILSQPHIAIFTVLRDIRLRRRNSCIAHTSAKQTKLPSPEGEQVLSKDSTWAEKNFWTERMRNHLQCCMVRILWNSVYSHTLTSP